MPRRPNMKTLQMQDTIDRLVKERDALKAEAVFASKELRAWFGNRNADAMHRMREDLVRVADRLDAAIARKGPATL